MSFGASLAAAIPVFVALFLAFFIESGALTIMVWIAGAIAVAIIHVQWVPLTRAE